MKLKYDPLQYEADKKEILVSMCLDEKTDKDEVLYIAELISDYIPAHLIPQRRLLNYIIGLFKNIDEKNLKVEMKEEKGGLNEHIKSVSFEIGGLNFLILLRTIRYFPSNFDEIDSLRLDVSSENKKISSRLYFLDDNSGFIAKKENTDFEEMMKLFHDCPSFDLWDNTQIQSTENEKTRSKE